jgi:enoyl-[acyl-carrier protein] reductase/trans-2-enoyl-CoA reductase (NAD+)
MKEKGLHEDCIEQLYRLYDEIMYNGSAVITDENGKLRIDDLEMRADVQEEVSKLWKQANSENIYEISDIAGFRSDFFKLFGFERNDINYDADVNLEEVL